MRSHPLDDAFDVERTEYQDEEYSPVVIPDNPELDTIINLALSAYQEQMGIASLVEPKNRIKYIEICEKLLGQAKDAMYKKGQLEIAKKKALAAEKKKTTPGTTLILQESDDSESQGIDRKKLYELAKQAQ